MLKWEDVGACPGDPKRGQSWGIPGCVTGFESTLKRLFTKARNTKGFQPIRVIIIN